MENLAIRVGSSELFPRGLYIRVSFHCKLRRVRNYKGLVILRNTYNEMRYFFRRFGSPAAGGRSVPLLLPDAIPNASRATVGELRLEALRAMHDRMIGRARGDRFRSPPPSCLQNSLF
jgi:hypothetical protein